MTRCPITYQPITGRYSNAGLKKLSPRLTDLVELPWNTAEQLQQAAARAPKMSIQGVQPKLSAILNIPCQCFEIVNIGGLFILKPPHPQFPELPENEDLSMRLAGIAGVAIPFHGMIWAKGGTRTYFIKRFDRVGRQEKRHVEDFSQLLGLPRDAKYDGSMEKVGNVIDRHCTFPALEKVKLLRLTLVNFLIGNEDMHLKNFSLITQAGTVSLSPAYDLLNTCIVLHQPQDEIALPLKGKKRKLDAGLLIEYFAQQRLKIHSKMIDKIMRQVQSAVRLWPAWIDKSFLSPKMKIAYHQLLLSRYERLFPESD